MMSKNIAIVLCLVGFVSVSDGQIVQPGQCEETINAAENIDINDFLGTWYEIHRSENEFQPGDCSTFTLTSNNDTVSINAAAVAQNFAETGSGLVTQTDTSGRLLISVDGLAQPLELLILLTIPSNYLLGYSCTNINSQERAVYIWTLSRQTTYSTQNIQILIQNFLQNTFGVNFSELREIRHTDDACLVLPDINAGEPVILNGQCADQNIPTVQNFNPDSFRGRWRLVESYHSAFQTGTCNEAEYVLDGANNGFTIQNYQVQNQILSSISGVATPSSNDGSATFEIVFSNTPGQRDYWIVATDYSSYALTYSCENLNNEQMRVNSWKFSRTGELSQEATVAINTVIADIVVLNNRFYYTIDRSDSGCFYFPPPDGSPVVFPNQCDENIPAMPNFDVARYLGTWYDIESYPQPFIFGTCNTANYALGDEGVIVFNTEVVNETLSTITGLATVASDDGSAKLLVTFPSLPEVPPTSLWVLNTDYDSYSLVYACQNIDEYSRQVISWKLSRTKELSNTANTNINNIISGIQVLDQQYFQVSDHTDEGCFYFPEPAAGESVIFPGQCDETIQAVPNFDNTRYAGIWYEVADYTKNDIPGECINYVFNTTNTNDMTLISSQVYNQDFTSLDGIVSRASTDGSGRFTITNTISGQAVSVPYWVIDTDYDNYALAYGCLNNGPYYRQIFSWKLSRTKEISTNSNNAINQAISSMRVLDEQYYTPTSQSDESCFFLPDLALNEPVIIPGQCDTNLPVVQQFDALNYLGTWRLVESYYSDFQFGVCNEARYSLDDNGFVVVYNTEVLNDTLTSMTGSAVLSTDGSARLTVTFPNADPIELWVLATDYSSYSLAYSCVNVGPDQRRVWSWKMSRTNSLTPEAQTAIQQVVQNVDVLNDKYFSQIDRSDEACFYFPTPDGSPVFFPGQCDENIPAMPNFDVARYLGTWYDIESYPQPFIFGTCNTANYALGDEGVIVFNTEVVNETLSTITGLATVASDDGSAKLLVTFPSLPEVPPTSLWVLNTDYDSYSLVYACQNIDEYSRQVISWKLSRTKELSNTANTNINNIISGIQVLDQQYFQVSDHTDEGCFYFPEPAAGEPVIFPGQCDETIQAVPNFDNSRYAGIWYEVADYTKNDIPGECINYAFNATNTNDMTLISSQVYNQDFTSLDGIVSRASTDGSGRFTITNTISGQAVSVPYWVIDTDYDNYALAYGCLNNGPYYRQIFSWKLSRTKEISTNSNNAINQAISSMRVLDEQYYTPTSQSDESCFFLPDLALNEPVIIPGQCDTNLPVVQQFDALNYLGTWRLVESYYSDFQFGVCNEARYSLDDNGFVVVYNTEVLNDTLTSMTGSAVLSTDGSARLTVTFPNADPIELWVLATDYSSYSLAYSCVNVGPDQRRVWSWKMSRTNSLTPEAQTAIQQVVQNVDVLNDKYFSQIDRSDEACFYFPTPDGSPVFFPGQCDENIPAMPNFDVARYLGTWYDIESYPQPFIFGTCNTANYALGDEGVIVFNTEVVNETLSTITGLAIVASDDGSAKLLVTFPSLPEVPPTSLWVLNTDYDSYSLVYACQNIDEFSRQVISWKLSRTKELSNTANTNINNIISGIQVLDQQYFQVSDHTDEGCFYFPEPAAGEPVIFPGQCDETIQAVPNFDNSRYAGIWHEVADYTKNDIPGECINYVFNTTNTNDMTLISSQVYNQDFTSLDGIVSRASTDGSGRFTITNTISGQPVSVPYWVIDTDYDNYALAYGCLNNGPYYRQIFSWKLSRTKEISTNSNNAINQAISSMRVLDEQYYTPTSQSDESCFFLPDLALNEPVVIPGQCDTNLPVVQQFDALNYLGTWRLVESYYSDFQFGVCNEARYSLDDNGFVVVYNTEVLNDTLTSMTGSAVLSTDGSARLTVTFPNADPIELWVLATDYSSYSLAYSCVNVGPDQRRVWSWKMSRTNSLTPEAQTAIQQVVQNVDVLNDKYFSQIDRSDEACFYFPTPDGSPVFFPGQCDENIPAMPSFDVARYLGTWYDIESYPQPFIFGTCNTANYALGDEGVIVFNTEVVNETLSTITGLATVASDDGSAKLLVTFPSLPEVPPTSLWVLNTDYDSYSLVYACQNIDDFSRQVISWKLSRTKELSNTANTNINNIISGIQVLDQQYFQVSDHTDEGCFYFPEPAAGEPVIFPGQCDETIQAVPNFDNTRYAGIWYEVADYTKNDIPGECINYAFNATNTNDMTLISSQVYDQDLTSLDGIVSRASTDGSGRFTITNTISGQPVAVPYWVIDTDYENYALAYGCLNDGQYYRQIFSWKLSRTKEISTNSNNAINQAISSIRVLDEQYYTPTSQSDDSCFYLPELTLNEPVIFPGQCDSNVPVIQNFDAINYLGTWRMIETYYSDFQFGTCNEATYSLDDNSFVVVYNTEVVNETLTSMTGSAVLSTDGSARLTVTFPNAEPIELWILATDYNSYSLAYSCQNISPDQRRVWSWKMSRGNTLSLEAVAAINQVTQNINVLDDRYFNQVDRTDAACFYYPEVVPGQTVIFNGQCDENIAVVQNFDLERYMGLWYDIESFPQDFQTGTCATADYTLTDAGVLVYNTEIINQRLFEINGVAVPAVQDNSAKFEVTFPVAGTNDITLSPYWVLSTDYETYALVYSCSNIDEFSRKVSSWKLSRTQTLSPTAEAIIENITNSIQVLDERYYSERGHSEDDCLFYPENNGGPVILQGQCNENITRISNFNINQFSGTWHEISRFPSELQTGECSNSAFTVNNDGSVTLTQTIVVNERLVTVSGTATPDTSGTITVNLSGDGGVTVQMTFNILDTDYDNFALIHSCRNLNSEEIQVYSWKLSKSRAGLTDNSINRINAIVSAERELFEDYYETTDQTNNGCFYYPVFDVLPSSIVLPGFCDASIQGIANFNVNAFGGQWFEHARYPNTFQEGQCNRVTFDSTSATAFVITNEHVSGQNLTEITGSAVVSNDGSGLLQVTIPGIDGPFNVYVLGTDYQNYALLYACQDRSDGDREVFSWQLSRGTAFNSNAALDGIILATQGLTEEYYAPTSQADDSCFYIPNPDQTQAVTFRGQCADISGMQGFNIASYVGWWHEIERYSTDGDVGECTSARYETVGNQYQVVETSVFGINNAPVSTHVVTATEDGRLRKTLPNGQFEDVWVLDTDYETYSLLYSCENYEENNESRRRVWSAKHSKTGSLSENAQQAMAPLIEQSEVLYPQFYVPVDQTDTACFHYPAVAPTSQVILRGQCDENIPVVQNFDAVEYSGTWYQMQKYPQLWESGNCIGARYTLDEDAGVVDVLNWEVIAGELVTIEGTATVISTDGSAKLSVILPVVGSATNATTSMDLYVLQTDYVSYAVAYSCENVNQFERSIGAWKLSRVRTLTSEADAAINALILQRPELHQPFFEDIEHEDCLEPSSGFIVRSSIAVLLLSLILNIV